MSEVLSQDNTLEAKVKDIVSQAAVDNISGEEMWMTLVYSGVALGVEYSREYFTQAGYEHVATLRDSISKIEAKLLLITDDETYKAISGLRDEFLRSLQKHASTLTEGHAKAWEENYGIPEDIIQGAHADEKALQRIGFFAMSRVPLYFFGWDRAVKGGTFSGMKCHCLSCVVEAITEPISPTKALNAAIKKAGGIADLMSGFGQFLVNESKEQLTKLLQGVVHDHDHEKSKVSVDDILKMAMKSSRDSAK